MTDVHRLSLRRLFVGLILSGAFVLGGTPAAAQPPEMPPGLFGYASGKKADKEKKTNPSASRARKVKIKSEYLDDDSVLLELFDDASFVAKVERRRVKANGTKVWVGKVPGAPQSQVVLAERNGIVSGTVRWDGRLFEINNAGDGKHSIEEIDASELPAHRNPLSVPADLQGFNESGTATVTSALESTANGAAVTIDLMVVYTEAARARYNPSDGGSEGIETRIEAAVADINTAYVNSQIDIQLNLVHLAKVGYNEASGDMQQSLNDLTYQSDGQLEEVHAWRDEYGADLVSLISEDGNYCGIAWQMEHVNSGFAPWAFNVVRTTCLSNQTLGHELGHNQGNEHNREHAGLTPAYSYSYGFRSTGAWRTVMSYNSGCNCPVIDHYSNPNVLYNSEPTGVDHTQNPSNSANNALSLNNTAPVVAAFRPGATVPPPPPAAPSGLVANATSDTAVAVSWTDNSDSETASELQRTSGAGWSTLATLGANVTSYNDNGLTPDTTYSYRVRASNEAGASGWSNSASATTPEPLPFVDDVAQQDMPVSGNVSNGFARTHGQDNSIQTIGEVESGGRKRNRTSLLDHRWSFNVTGGASVTFYANTYASNSSDGDSFVFAYSANGGGYTDMFTVTKTQDDDSYYAFVLPPSVSGPVTVKVYDTDRTAGNRSRDSVKVDHIYFRSDNAGGGGGGGGTPPPAAPSGLTADAMSDSRIDLDWSDGSTNELGFRVESSLNQSSWEVIANVPANATSYSDTGLAGATEHHYRVRAYNTGGESAASEASATTLVGGGIDLTASGYKVKGKQKADLDWTGATTANVDIYRDGSLISTTANDGAFTDPINKKGGGSYAYEVCEAGSSDCSDPVSVVF